jgi:hypothetical protein
MTLQPIETAPKDGSWIMLAWVERDSLMFRVERGAFHVGFKQWYVPSQLGVEPLWWDFSPPYPIPKTIELTYLEFRQIQGKNK